MRKCFVFALVALLCAPAMAKADDDQPSSHRLIKVLVGAGALAVGAAVAATSSQSTTVNSAVVGASETSTFSKSQLITGLALAGAGGIVLWDGLRTHPVGPSTQVGVSAGQHTQGVFIRRVW